MLSVIDSKLQIGERRLPDYRFDVWKFLFSPILFDKTENLNVMSGESATTIAPSPMKFKNESNTDSKYIIIFILELSHFGIKNQGMKNV